MFLAVVKLPEQVSTAEECLLFLLLLNNKYEPLGPPLDDAFLFSHPRVTREVSCTTSNRFVGLTFRESTLKGKRIIKYLPSCYTN